MKKARLLTGILLLSAAVACRKNHYDYDRGNNNNGHSQTGNAAGMVGSSLSRDADGIVTLVANVTLNAQAMFNAHSACGTAKSDSTSQQSAAGATTTYSYVTKNNITVLCDTASQPDSALNTSTYTGSFKNANVTSANSGSSNFTIGGILPSITSYTVNGEYKRSGSYTYSDANKTATTSNIDIVLNKLLVSKPYRGITAGTATFTISGTDTQNGTATTNGNYSYTGTLTFNNTNYAVLALNGTNYNVNLTTGAVAAQ